LMDGGVAAQAMIFLSTFEIILVMLFLRDLEARNECEDAERE
jgi:hypothetical protein